MSTFEKAPRDILWLCVDSLRADALRVSGAPGVRPTYLDLFAREGVFFSNCMATGQSTLPSAFSYFTSLAPSVNGVLTQTANAIPLANPKAVTITDILRHNGWSTWRWDDMNTYSCQPKSGFDHFEGGYFNLEDTPADSFDAPRRHAFLDRFNQVSSPRFLYMHLDHIHEYGGESASVWTRSKYLELAAHAAREVRAILEAIRGSDQAVVLLNADHGVTLDEDWSLFEDRHGGSFHEGRTRTFAMFRAPGLASRKVDAVVSALDLAPSLLEMVGISDMKAQGASLLSAMLGQQCHVPPALMEWAPRPAHKHVIGGNPPRTPRTVRLCSDAWTLDHALGQVPVFTPRLREEAHLAGGAGATAGRPEGDAPGCGTLLGTDALPAGEATKPGQEAYARALALLEAFENAPRDPDHVYAMHGQTFRKEHIPPQVSVLLPAEAVDGRFRPCLLSLMDQIPTTEILVLDLDPSGGVEGALEEFSGHPFLLRVKAWGLALHQALNLGLKQARSGRVALASRQYRYTENALYELLAALVADGRAQGAYCNVYEVLRDSREDYLYMGPDTFYVSHSLWNEGSGSVRNLGAFSPQRLEIGNPLGECMLFSRSAMLHAGGFASGDDTVGDAWRRMAQGGPLVHVPRPLIVASGILAAPVLGIASARPARRGVSVVVVPNAEAESGPSAEKALRLLLHYLMDHGPVVAEILLASPPGWQSLSEAVARGAASDGVPVRALPEAASEAEARNVAVRQAGGEYLMWLRPGELPALGALERMARRLDDRPGAALAMPAGPGGEPASLAGLWAQPRGLAAVLYRADLHRAVGGFHGFPAVAMEWDMLLRLAEAGAVESMDGVLTMGVARSRAGTDLVAGCGAVSGSGMHPGALEAVLRAAVGRMNGCIDVIRLFPEVFSAHGPNDGVELILPQLMELMRRNPAIAHLRIPFTAVDEVKFASPAWAKDDGFRVERQQHRA